MPTGSSGSAHVTPTDAAPSSSSGPEFLHGGRKIALIHQETATALRHLRHERRRTGSLRLTTSEADRDTTRTGRHRGEAVPSHRADSGGRRPARTGERAGWKATLVVERSGASGAVELALDRSAAAVPEFHRDLRPASSGASSDYKSVLRATTSAYNGAQSAATLAERVRRLQLMPRQGRRRQAITSAQRGGPAHSPSRATAR